MTTPDSTTRAPGRGECDYCGGAHFNRDCPQLDDVRREATHAALAAVRERVERLANQVTLHTCWDDHAGPGGGHANGSPCPDQPQENVARAAVLAILDELDPR